MNHNKRHLVNKLFAFLAIVLILSVLACAAPSQTPAKPATPVVNKPAEVSIPVSADISGPYAALSPFAQELYTVATEYWNEKYGGIDGVPVKLNIRDCKGTVECAVNFYNELVASKQALVYVLYSSSQQEPLKSRLPEDKVVIFSGASSPPSAAPPGWIFMNLPAYCDLMGMYIDWIVDVDWKTKGKPGNPKVAVLTWDSAFGRGILTKETQDYMKQRGVDYVGAAFVPVGVPVDTKNQITRLVELKADYVISNYHTPAYSVSLRDAEKLGVKDNFTWINLSTGTDRLVEFVGKDIAEGVITGGLCADWELEADLPFYKETLQKFEKISAGKGLSGFTTSGATDLMMSEICSLKAIELTVKRVGWDKLNGAEVEKTARTEMTNYDVEGVLKALGWDETRRSSAWGRLTIFKDGKQTLLQDWRTLPNLLPK